MNRLLLFAAFVLLFAFNVAAQTSPSSPPPPAPKPKQTDDLFKDQDISLPEEMRMRMAIERADNEHKKILADVDKLSDLSAEVARGFQDHGKLSADEVKKLGSIEKLAKKILGHAGGDEVDDKSGRVEQMSVADCVTNINSAAAVIKKTMTTESRHVVSATVIANSNDIINIAQFLRRAQK
jgi:predicted hydrolase (HD superfamily)